MLAFACMVRTSTMERLNIVPRLAFTLSTVACALVLALHVVAPETDMPATLSSSLLLDLDVDRALQVPSMVAAGAWTCCAVVCIIVYCLHQRQHCAGRSLWLPPPPPRNPRGLGSKAGSWTGSFRVVNDWNAMEESWSGSILGSVKELEEVKVTTTGVSARSRAHGGSKGKGLRMASLKRPAAFKNSNELKEQAGGMELESLLFDSQDDLGLGGAEEAKATRTGPSPRHASARAARILSREANTSIYKTPQHRKALSPKSRHSSQRESVNNSVRSSVSAVHSALVAGRSYRRRERHSRRASRDRSARSAPKTFL